MVISTYGYIYSQLHMVSMVQVALWYHVPTHTFERKRNPLEKLFKVHVWGKSNIYFFDISWDLTWPSG